jgi:hypothetical protein
MVLPVNGMVMNHISCFPNGSGIPLSRSTGADQRKKEVEGLLPLTSSSCGGADQQQPWRSRPAAAGGGADQQQPTVEELVVDKDLVLEEELVEEEVLTMAGSCRGGGRFLQRRRPREGNPRCVLG